MRKRQFLFRLFYSTSFTILLIIEILLLLISPGDIIYQSFAASRRLNIIAIAIVYVAVLLVSAFIIATRFYTAHTQLTAIPRSYIPIGKGDLSKSLRNLIATEFARSTAIAYHAHPREVGPDDIDALSKRTTLAESGTITWSLDHMKSWKEIQHPGWSSPCVRDLPGLQFDPIILEFPHLIEAKAISLAPSDPLTTQSIPGSTTDLVIDLRVIDLLQRPASMSLRQYINRLQELEMLVTDSFVGDFLTAYEFIRFSDVQLSDPEFRSLLNDFTTIMQELELPSELALKNFGIQSPSLSQASSRSVLRPGHTRNLTGQYSTRQAVSPTIQDSDLTQNNGTENEPTLDDRSLTPFFTPVPYPYPASSSSGHAGDQSSDSSEYEDDQSIRTPNTRHAQQIRNRTPSLSGLSGTPVRNFSRNDDVDLSGSHAHDAPEENASILQRPTSSRTNQSVQSHGSRISYMTDGSVIHHRTEGGSVLPLPMVDGTGHGRESENGYVT